jgi:hypothetical protein
VTPMFILTPNQGNYPSSSVFPQRHAEPYCRGLFDAVRFPHRATLTSQLPHYR